MRTVDQLFENSDITVEDVSERSGLSVERVEAIAVGRWTPSPAERVKIASAFGVGIERICMGRHGITDIREFFKNDVRFLEQF